MTFDLRIDLRGRRAQRVGSARRVGEKVPRGHVWVARLGREHVPGAWDEVAMGVEEPDDYDYKYNCYYYYYYYHYC